MKSEEENHRVFSVDEIIEASAKADGKKVDVEKLKKSVEEKKKIIKENKIIVK